MLITMRRLFAGRRCRQRRASVPGRAGTIIRRRPTTSRALRLNVVPLGHQAGGSLVHWLWLYGLRHFQIRRLSNKKSEGFWRLISFFFNAVVRDIPFSFVFLATTLVNRHEFSLVRESGLILHVFFFTELFSCHIVPYPWCLNDILLLARA